MSSIDWIPIKDEKPKLFEWVLLANDKDKWVDRGSIERDGKYRNGEVEVIPTHWAKMPSPPKFNS